MRKAFDTFVKNIEAIADEWPTYHAATAAAEATSLRYNAAAEAAIDAVAVKGQLPERLTNHNVRNGCSILTRYCEIAAELAAKDGCDIDRLTAILQDDRSFDGIASIADTQNKLAARTETEIGLKPYELPPYDYYLNQYSIDDNYVHIKDLDFVIVRKRLEMLDEGKELTDSQCAAHANGALKPVFHAFITICARDENLFARSLDQASSQADK